jgi:putative transposase
MRYRRANTAGGTYFFTVNLADRSSTLLVDEIDLLRDAMRLVQRRHPFHIDAIVILTDHLHAMWTLPPDDAALQNAGD